MVLGHMGIDSISFSPTCVPDPKCVFTLSQEEPLNVFTQLKEEGMACI